MGKCLRIRSRPKHPGCAARGGEPMKHWFCGDFICLGYVPGGAKAAVCPDKPPARRGEDMWRTCEPSEK
ncbi:hypothetical protein LJC32_05830 [Oscillospiraceae bacterium OttesenSCG-928-F05]|nr:hypothetical protein [Oscillospiraceae bacterium OttesenSCG-928-F05]